MTTIACNLREMAADSRVTWEGVGTDTVSGIKIFAGNGALYGVTGENCTGSLIAIEWIRAGAHKDFRPTPPEFDNGWDWKLIELSPEGIAIYNEYLEREMTSEPFLAVGSGRKVAMYCMKYLGMSPAQAVREACKVDHWSNVPIYTGALRGLAVRKWNGKKAK